MTKVSLQLGAELDLLNKSELDDVMGRHFSREADRQVQAAAYGVRHQELQRMYATVAGGNIALGFDQPDGQYCGPKSGWVWAVDRISVDGLATGDAVKVYKQTKFVCWISYQPGFATFGKRGLILSDGDYLRIVGTGLMATGQVEVFGEGVSAPGPMMWKLIS